MGHTLEHAFSGLNQSIQTSETMQRERVADDVYVFTSDRYVQVTASVVITTEGAVLFDTLLFPDETRQIKQFVEGRLGCPVKYVINSHYHADHTYGTCLFPNALVIAHARCGELLNTRGREGLHEAKQNAPELASVEVVIPQLVFNTGTMPLQVGGKTFHLWHSPGHSPDSVACLVREDRVLLAGDTVMALPYFVDGSYSDLLQSVQQLQSGSFENIIQGHGEIILRGEIESRLQSDVRYLLDLKREVDLIRKKPEPETHLDDLEMERCGKSRILLGGYARQLHRANVRAMFYLDPDYEGNAHTCDPTAADGG